MFVYVEIFVHMSSSAEWDIPMKFGIKLVVFFMSRFFSFFPT
jgi:hypothetical protein